MTFNSAYNLMKADQSSAASEKILIEAKEQLDRKSNVHKEKSKNFDKKWNTWTEFFDAILIICCFLNIFLSSGAIILGKDLLWPPIILVILAVTIAIIVITIIWYKKSLKIDDEYFDEFNEDMKTYKLAYINRMRTLTESQLKNVIAMCKNRPLTQKEVSLLEDFLNQSF